MRPNNLPSGIIERCVFRYRSQEVYLVADTQRGRQIEQAILDFFDAAAAESGVTVFVPPSHQDFVSSDIGSQLNIYFSR